MTEAKAFLENAAELLGRGSAFLIGVDLKKSLDILIPAYDDADGVTAAFSLNLLARVNRELDGDFDTTTFAHVPSTTKTKAASRSIWRASPTRTCSARPQLHVRKRRTHPHRELPQIFGVRVPGRWRAARAGGRQAWTDDDDLFSLHLLRLA